MRSTLERTPALPSQGTVEPSAAASLVSADGIHVARSIFVDPAIYAAEKHLIFARSWLFLGHESQLPQPGDFLTTRLAETPVIVTRSRGGAIRAHVNSCSHRGLPVCRADLGNAHRFVCPYHGWTYDGDGALVAVPQERKVGRIDRSSLGLPAVPRIESYRGFLFGSLDAQIEPLADYLGDMRFYLDTYLDRFPGGIELVGPPQKWRLRANWKLPYENQLGDLGHASYLHGALFATNDAGRETEAHGFAMVPRAGHSASLRLMPEESTAEERAWGIEGVSAGMDPELLRYLLAVQAEAERRLGPLRARIKGLTLGIYPNLNFVWSNHALRVSHPCGPDETEIWTWLVLPKDAPDSIRRALRGQYNYVLGPGGIVEQEDSEAWAQQWIGSRSDYPQDRPYHYGLGAGQERPHPELPGMASGLFNEYYARAFYQRWRADMLRDERA
ncbi:aromatic ring-hydroxylating oxygenase subunit alpha [Flavisphingomonas formosensis]|uniref:aromatic ring-hydroxylating oxygenase subunit alpha n=1 Tax=Flavisphingomonas formosensis TaxID=861534 RepID=UPI0012FAF069|nr:Rieske 2Fe-2S domain-containing protein [Sphingomonas formosensis]